MGAILDFGSVLRCDIRAQTVCYLPEHTRKSFLQARDVFISACRDHRGRDRPRQDTRLRHLHKGRHRHNGGQGW